MVVVAPSAGVVLQGGGDAGSAPPAPHADSPESLKRQAEPPLINAEVRRKKQK